jgi:hypothetical protein
MWIFLNDAFLSVVQHQNNRDSLLVRARVAGDLERVLPDATVTYTPEDDYAYRTVVTRKEFTEALAHAVEEINYPNFKDSVHESDRHHAYMDVWNAMRRLQAREESRKPRSK